MPVASREHQSGCSVRLTLESTTGIEPECPSFPFSEMSEPWLSDTEPEWICLLCPAASSSNAAPPNLHSTTMQAPMHEIIAFT